MAAEMAILTVKIMCVCFKPDIVNDGFTSTLKHLKEFAAQTMYCLLRESTLQKFRVMGMAWSI